MSAPARPTVMAFTPADRIGQAKDALHVALAQLDAARAEVDRCAERLALEVERATRPAPGGPMLATIKEAAALLGCGEREIYRLLAAGTLPKYTVGTRGVRIPIAALQARVAASMEVGA